MNLVERIKYEFKHGGSLKTLIIINVLAFLFLKLIYIFSELFNAPVFYKWVGNTLSMPGELSGLLFQPWSMVTSLFMHADIFHLLFNMIMLYYVGNIFLTFFSQKKLVLTYILGGIAGNLLHTLSYDIFPFYMHISPMGVIGASGAVYAFFGAILYYRPTLNVQLIFGINIPFWLLALFFLIGDFTALTKPDGVAHFAHIGGALFGVISMLKVEERSQFMNRLERWFYGIQWRNIFKSKPKMKVYKNKDYRKMNDDQYRDSKKEQQDKINAILDKVSKGGYDSISKAEKEFLFKFSNEKK
ncbi:hypothetical protein DNU06_05300 [Putridiphycobacter roseus]|uniref:Uncharacterized protein n=1 Tax=Putridiphycobacter roseus TaxID=2219161 RepID=A0A2W1NEZ0_9FLAO|nr:rhomboid family intramembrane serine protease [Putridiphycobacter roseus]PZE18035.1 hypothetical protein DNU06_05300 [Putridiphycobacter roseus]